LKVLSHENAADGLFQHFHPGPLRGSPTRAAAQLAALRQCSPNFPGWLHCSATPEGRKTFPDKLLTQKLRTEAIYTFINKKTAEPLCMGPSGF